MKSAQVRNPIILILLLLWLVGCTQTPGLKRTPPIGTDADVTRAAQLAAQGDFLGAAALYSEVAQRAPVDSQGELWVRAAENYRSGGDLDGARAALGAAASVPMTSLAQLRKRLLEVELLMDETRASDALVLLLDPPPPDIPTDLAIRYRKDTARAFRLMGNLLESARELQVLDGLLTDARKRFDNQLEIVRSLAVLSEQALSSLQPSPPGIEGGWMELARVLKRASTDPSLLPDLMIAWRQQFPIHPALPGLLEGYFEEQQSLLTRAAHVAVLLPEQGPYAKVAAAIRDGLMASWYQDAEASRPELRFYDSSSTSALWPTYSQAVAEGADIVIGPLEKEAVELLMRAGDLPIPVLALNQVQIEVVPPVNLFQFSLSPEGEARQVAEHAWLKGRRRPVLLTPTGDWGDRIATAFAERWQSLGGEVAGQQSYDENSTDHSAPIQQLLLLDASRQRHTALQRLLGTRIEFEPRRRQDVDMVFIAARPKQTRMLRPQLQFHHADDLPVYATSHAWTGTVVRREAEDVTGIYLPDMPWYLTEDSSSPVSRVQLQQSLPAAGGAYGRLYAMGLDAYLLLPHLARLQSSPLEALAGHTGILSNDGSNQIQRQLVWARLGQTPEILGYSPRLDLERNPPPSSPDNTTAEPHS